MKCLKGMTFDTCPFNPRLGCDCGYNKKKDTMKVLFLDVDGVLNNDLTKEKCCGYVGVDKALAKRLVQWYRFHEKTGLKIVLSSTWRLHPEMWPALNAEGIEWIGITPHLMSKDRGDEISEWLSAHHGEITGYAVLDDNQYNILDLHYRKFVQTNPEVGLTEDDLIKLSTILCN